LDRSWRDVARRARARHARSLTVRGTPISAFRYEAVDARGKAKRGLVDAESVRHVRDRLRGDGLTPTVIEAAGSATAPAGGVDHRKIAPTLLALSTRQLATLLRSGMPLDQALSAVAEQADDKRVAGVFDELRGHIASGESLASALARWPRTFSDLYRGLVAVGAETGRLPDVMERLADYLEASQAMRQKFTLALIYPALVTIIALAVIVALLVYVVPQVVSVYQQSRQTLPWLTQALIAVSAFVRATGWFWVAGGALSAIGIAIANRRPAFRLAWHARLLRVPVIGRLVRAIDTARFASTLAILTASGAPLLRSLDAACGVMWALPLRQAGATATALVREGVSLARALKEQRVFPPVLIHLVANGEASGQLAPMLGRAAAELERESERRLAWFAALLQPALIVVMGAVVLALVLAVMLPIVSMNQLIR
jgi:general secretion pathway protein F